MWVSKIVPLVVFFCLLGANIFSQNGELGRSDCTYAKEIIVPFDHGSTPENKIKPLLEQKVFYNFRDQFTFWYKVVVKKNNTINFKAIPLNDSDSYSVVVYNYNQNDFCNKVFFQKIKPVKTTLFVGKGSESVEKENQRAFLATAENVYYIGVLNTSLNNCGHRFFLTYGKDTLKVDAIHLPCKRDVTSLSVKTTKPPAIEKEEPLKLEKVQVTIKDSVNKPVTEIKIDSVKKETPVVKDPALSKKFSLEIVTLNSKNKRPVDSKINVYEKVTSQPQITTAKAKGFIVTELEENKTYVVKTTAFGYKNNETTINATEFFSQKKDKTEILLEPLKAGDSFIMKSIYFVPNTYALRKESLGELEKLLTFLKNNDNIFIEIQGHTNGDNRIAKNPSYESLGEEWNFSGTAKKLSQKRAEVIRDYLTTNGIIAERLIAKGYGGQKMIIKDPESNEEGQQNIRVEIYVLKN